MTNDLCLTIYQRPPGNPGGMRQLPCTYLLDHDGDHSWASVLHKDRSAVLMDLFAGRNGVADILEHRWATTLDNHHGNTEALNDLKTDLRHVVKNLMIGTVKK